MAWQEDFQEALKGVDVARGEVHRLGPVQANTDVGLIRENPGQLKHDLYQQYRGVDPQALAAADRYAHGAKWADDIPGKTGSRFDPLGWGGMLVTAGVGAANELSKAYGGTSKGGWQGWPAAVIPSQETIGRLTGEIDSAQGASFPESAASSRGGIGNVYALAQGYADRRWGARDQQEALAPRVVQPGR